MEQYSWLQQVVLQGQIQNILETNVYTEKFGLSLTKEDVKLLIQERCNTLKEQQRIEFGEGILTKLIFTFCDSLYIEQRNYLETIIRLQEIFYLYKNESMDGLTDDELLEVMKNAFDGECEGALEYLEDTILENLARSIRRGEDDFKENY